MVLGDCPHNPTAHPGSGPGDPGGSGVPSAQASAGGIPPYLSTIICGQIIVSALMGGISWRGLLGSGELASVLSSSSSSDCGDDELFPWQMAVRLIRLAVQLPCNLFISSFINKLQGRLIIIIIDDAIAS